MKQGERVLARSPCLVSTVASLPSFRFQSEAFGFLVSTQPSAASSIVLNIEFQWSLCDLSFNGRFATLVSTVASLPSFRFQRKPAAS